MSIVNKDKINELDYSEALFYLKLYYEKILEIHKVFCSGGIIFRDPQLNEFYIMLKTAVEIILERDDFGQLNNSYPTLLESVAGNIENLDIFWGVQSKKAYDFLGKIEKEGTL